MIWKAKCSSYKRVAIGCQKRTICIIDYCGVNFFMNDMNYALSLQVAVSPSYTGMYPQ